MLDLVQRRVSPQKDPIFEDGTVPSLRDFHEIVQKHWETVRFHDLPEEQRPPAGGAQPQDPRTHG